jgi:chromosome segregation ATPase
MCSVLMRCPIPSVGVIQHGACVKHAEAAVASGDGDEVEFARYIVPSGAAETTYQSQYKLDNRTVSWDAYNAKLRSFGILVKARNFLVFQVC